MRTRHSAIDFRETGFFSPLICDYVYEPERVRHLFNNDPTLEGFKMQISEKNNFPTRNREVLSAVLSDQMSQLTLSDSQQQNISLINKTSTYTVTTGHQLNLFTGPLYFLYKIISTINLANQLKVAYPKCDFIPVYWMATEDHDFEEIQFFNYKNTKVSWNRESGGPVGRFDGEGLEQVFERFSSMLGSNRNANQIRSLFEKAYLEGADLSQATRLIAHELFSSYGLLILDGDDRELKRMFAPYMKKELHEGICWKTTTESNEFLESNYKVQVNPREINLFYIENGIRERVIKEGEGFKVNNTDLYFDEKDMETLLENTPENLSPNVLMRPLYQEVILPNLAYIGGGGELAYWLQLKSVFKTMEVPFPILILRNSVLLCSAKQVSKMNKLEVDIKEMFNGSLELSNKKVRAMSEIEIDLSDQRVTLERMFKELKLLSDRTDKSFSGAVLAQEKKQLNGLEKLEKRLLKAQKRKHQELLGRITSLQEQLFPGGNLQERKANFSEFFEIYGDDLIRVLIEKLDPLTTSFDILTLEESN